MSENNKEFPKPIKLIPMLIPKPRYSHNSADATTTAAQKLIPTLRPMSNQSDAQAYIPLEPSTSSTNAILNESLVHLPQEPATNVNQNEIQVHLPQEPPINVNQNETQIHLPPEPSESFTASLLTNPNEKRLKPANVYILNHVKFDDRDEEREGSDKDVEKLTKTFKKFKCNVEEIRNATLETVQITASRLERENFEEHSALVIVILSHGTHNDMISARDKTYSLQEHIILPILKNPTLSKKPKLIFVQACKGGFVGFQPDSTSVHPNANEVFVFYSTFEGYLSWRHHKEGSPFIHALCKSLKEDGDTKDINVISKRVIDMVKNDTKGKQVPYVSKTLYKEYIFGHYMEN
ncbi:uncharacterized protein Dwil_GK27102 [Drosophila willistoni]|uniref:Caspase family p20 domain-containing protein n=1 Tax=Drosophila willistoni TaxID=7260 RepID=A0A0Q9WT17_DROWI|nr:caspase-3 [Drosophila willistoni]KRF99092.1 uncharacterized protein Dwil_GK27102 [Drosophila willistoni]